MEKGDGGVRRRFGKKGVTNIVSSILLVFILVSFISVFYGDWFLAHMRGSLTDVDVIENRALNERVLIENIIREQLYVKSTSENAFNLDSVLINKEVCGSDYSLVEGLNEINVSSCLAVVNSEVVEVVLVADDEVVYKRVVLE